ncbi:hypothetical protein GIB67_009690 [Kingdonia uniflora]|uniref:Pectinesterase n=1 Tax=Kingdonia uniflora TaxID=39325 RepID=A0A7J7LB54_9MAGN|nr:hypothetical protein GIB67_009690 [Kingdonia uniflora]
MPPLARQDGQDTQIAFDYCFEFMTLSLRRLNETLLALDDSPLNLVAVSHSNKFSRNGCSSRDRKLLQTTDIKANVVVAKDGSGDYATIAKAINAANGGRFVIHVKTGVYKEKIHTNKDGVTLIGDGKYSTIIAYDDNTAKGTTMPNTATFAISGDGFIARVIGFQNTAGPSGDQALALSVISDHSVFYRCSISGYQDTLYAFALCQFYRECNIQGTIDFIFGNAIAVFQNCMIILRRPSSNKYNVILAHGREDPGQNTGFVVQRCSITVETNTKNKRFEKD